ncbi:protein E26A [Elephant endotheliotropic herpesvirus 3A]|uniref:Protein E26A n=1 Tax=Elephant endotheliotropic herpesvirus 3A TaxID=1329409 RepID=A0A866VSX9_9BETA|nr:protein E26A [Elephant endotheliotropic herpesvirus 3A]QOE74400.1 protein E26A [Elephant endotheliotropic herpesvirus 3A]
MSTRLFGSSGGTRRATRRPSPERCWSYCGRTGCNGAGGGPVAPVDNVAVLYLSAQDTVKFVRVVTYIGGGKSERRRGGFGGRVSVEVLHTLLVGLAYMVCGNYFFKNGHPVFNYRYERQARDSPSI